MNCDSDEAARQRADNLAKAEAVDIEFGREPARLLRSSVSASLTKSATGG
jgi:hypothetical protein